MHVLCVKDDASTSSPLLKKCRAFFAYWGEVAAAGAEAVAVQRSVLRMLPAQAAERVDVAASVCTDVPSILHSQPSITTLAGAVLELS